MKRYEKYQDYVIKEGKLVGEFEQMYQDFEDPWEQSEREKFASEKAVHVNLIESLSCGSVVELSCDKALADLEWQPTLGFPHTVKMTVDWYKEYYANGDNKSMLDFTLDQILEYTDLATSKKNKKTFYD